MYTTSVCARNFGPLGEIGTNFSLQLSSRTQLAKINNKKVIGKNQCEKHKKSSLTLNEPITTKVVCFSALAEMFKKPLWQTVWTQIRLLI